MVEGQLREQPAELLRRLIRFDTTNPPGNEAACVGFLESLLSDAGLDTRVLAKAEGRPNLIARLPGGGRAAPLLLHCHVDVVTTEGQDWTHPPFDAEVDDGFIWGRGALDMKAGVAMMAAALLRARAREIEPAGDVIFAAMSDEENGSRFGAHFLVAEHGSLLEDARYALGEFGGSTMHVAGRRLYPVQVAEKAICRTHLRLHGPGGHGSLPMRGGTMARLAEVLRTLDRRRLPVHVTPAARAMIEGVAAGVPRPLGVALHGLLRPRLTDRLLDAMGSNGEFFDPVLHNTVNATVVRSGEEESGNVVPGEAEVVLDARLLPGQTAADLERELCGLLGDDLELESEDVEPESEEIDMGLFGTLAGILREADPGSTPHPMLLAARTDGSAFAKLGIQPYGFTPLKLPEGFEFQKLVHAADERVPVDAVEFGTDCMLKAIERFGEAG